MTDKNYYYVYLYFRLNGLPMWVGKGCKYRWDWCYHIRYKNSHINNAILQITRSGKEIPRIKLFENLSEKEAFAMETLFIKSIGRSPNGPLLNLTDGGEGVSGRISSDETKIKITQKLRGHIVSDDTRNKIRAKLLGRKVLIKKLRGPNKTKRRPMSAESRVRISKTLSGRKLPPEHCNNIRKGNLGKKRSPQACANIAAGQNHSMRLANQSRDVWNDPVKRNYDYNDSESLYKRNEMLREKIHDRSYSGLGCLS